MIVTAAFPGPPSATRCPRVTRAARRLIDAFEAGRIDPDGFAHRDHVRLAWAYLQCHTLPETLDVLPRALRAFAAAHGAPDRYHETITWAYIMLIDTRLRRQWAAGTDPGFGEFARANGDLLVWPSPILQRHYRAETICSARAREHFVWPDRCEAGWSHDSRR